ncbi:M56 family metallopeptidase [Virgibacillus proomii]|uniref:M56 family metallopeptidase n=1 Tax=Virgibacillus proomii TaxID=84407 RepID=UPI001C100080|nr:M56 family metallopeptidase [Virgibacillus proomii]MBU5266708.1 M56 family metallopeptidase [Virgibacillus proomii]
MQKFMIALFESSLSMSVIALIYIAITPLLAKKFSATGRYYAWLVIIVGLIIPFRFHPKVSAIYVDAIIPTLKETANYSLLETVSSAPKTFAAIPWYVPVSGLWAAGVVVFLVYHVIRNRRFQKMVKRWSVEMTDQEVFKIFQDLKSEFGVAQKATLKVCPGISSPMLLGFFRPTILLPAYSIPKDKLELILKHELIHLKRKDLWYKTLVFIAAALHWFNPFVYIVAREISIQCELSCDEQVVKDADSPSRQNYVAAIIGMMKKQTKEQTLFSTHFFGSKQGIQNRVYSIMDAKRKKWGISILIIAAMATLSTGTVLKLSSANSESISSTSASQVEERLKEDNLQNLLTDPISSANNLESDKDGNHSELNVPMNSTMPLLLEDKDDSEPDTSTNDTTPFLFKNDSEADMD